LLPVVAEEILIQNRAN